MPLTQIFNEFQASLLQCDSLIANAHKADATGTPFFSDADRRQITIAAFLNMFIAWEGFLESSLAHLMTGGATRRGVAPIKYVSPLTKDIAKSFVIGTNRFFDYANNENMKKIARMYFKDGYPYEPHLSAITTDLADLKTLRNASAHITSTTQTALEGLALRIFTRPMTGINLYQVLTTPDPRSPAGATVFEGYKNKLLVTADIISQR